MQPVHACQRLLLLAKRFEPCSTKLKIPEAVVVVLPNTRSTYYELRQTPPASLSLHKWRLIAVWEIRPIPPWLFTQRCKHQVPSGNQDVRQQFQYLLRRADAWILQRPQGSVSLHSAPPGRQIQLHRVHTPQEIHHILILKWNNCVDKVLHLDVDKVDLEPAGHTIHRRPIHFCWAKTCQKGQSWVECRMRRKHAKQ